MFERYKATAAAYSQLTVAQLIVSSLLSRPNDDESERLAELRGEQHKRSNRSYIYMVDSIEMRDIS